MILSQAKFPFKAKNQVDHTKYGLFSWFLFVIEKANKYTQENESKQKLRPPLLSGLACLFDKLRAIRPAQT